MLDFLKTFLGDLPRGAPRETPFEAADYHSPPPPCWSISPRSTASSTTRSARVCKALRDALWPGQGAGA